MAAPWRRLGRALLAVAAATTVLAVAAPARAEEPTVVMKGGGWGHSVGMSQYGAYGQALEGRSAATILSHYYRGAHIGVLGTDLPAAGNLWVNLSAERTGLRLVPRAISSPAAPVVITRGSETFEVAADGTVIEILSDHEGCTVMVGSAEVMPAGSCSIDLDWDGFEASPTTRVDQAAQRDLAGQWSDCKNRDWNGVTPVDRVCTYSRGRMHVRPDDGHATNHAVHLVAEMDVDKYVLGIAEMPYYWGQRSVSDPTIDPKGLEALKAQAVAARSYALARAVRRGDPAGPGRDVCWCHVYDTTRDQNYVGWGHGATSWITAANATAGQVLIHDQVKSATGQFLPLEAFYMSSSYGHTEPNESGFGTSPEPYLRSEDDHWAADGRRNPRATWTKTFTVSGLAAKLGMDTLTGITIVKRSESGAIETLRFEGTPRAQVHHTRFLRTPLGLFSPQLTSVTLPPPSNPVKPPSAAASAADTVGVHDERTGIFALHAGPAPFYFGNPKDIPYAGDWNCDGVTTLGLYRVSTGFLFLRNSNTQGIADVEIYYGDPGDLPIAGDWDGDGCETVGIFRPSEGRFYLRNANTQGIADVSAEFGRAGDVPVAGDWDGDGIDTYGVYRPSDQMVYLTNDASAPAVDVEFWYAGAAPGDRVVAGDWDGDGDDTVGVFRPDDATFYLRDTFTQPSANLVIPLGEPHMTPVAGFWG